MYSQIQNTLIDLSLGEFRCHIVLSNYTAQQLTIASVVCCIILFLASLLFQAVYKQPELRKESDEPLPLLSEAEASDRVIHS